MYCNSDSFRFSVLCIGLLTAFVTAASVDAGERAEPPGRYSRYSFSLANAGEAGEPLVVNLHSRDGEIRTGWASVGYETGFVRDHQLRCEGDQLSGRLAVDVGPLQYICDLEASAAGNELAGTYTGRRGIAGAAEGISGTASGRLSPRAAGGDLQVLLHFWSMYTEFGHIRNPDVEATVRDGKITGGKFEFGRKAENRGRLDGGELAVQNGRLKGSIRATVLAGDAARGTYTFVIDAPIHHNFVQGTYETKKDGDDWGTHGLTGEVHGRDASSDGGVLVLALDDGLEGQRPLALYLGRQLDRFPGGMARGGNTEFHAVDASGLRLAGKNLTGTIEVTILPGESFPPGGRAVKCHYTVQATVANGEASGEFTGRYGIQSPLHGQVQGSVLSVGKLTRVQARAAGAGQVDPGRIYSPSQAAQIGWPALAGPYGTFLPVRTDVPLVEDLSQATIAWVSENADLGIGKQGTPFHKSFQAGEAVKKYLGADADRHPGSWAGVITAEGRVFAASFRPTGPYFECDFPDGTPAKVRVDAEDIVVAMDFRTGHTLWLAAEPGGILTGGGKRQGFQVAPVYSDGKVFAMGSTGRLFAYDADTGVKLWQTDIGEVYRRQAETRDQILADLSRRKFSYPSSPGWHTSLIVAEDTLIVPTFSKGALRGLDAASGQIRWEAEGVGSHLATPSIWRHDDRDYILTANTSGEMRLLDPRDGRELWKVDGIGGSYFTLSPSPTHVLVNVNPKSGKGPDGERIPGFFGCYRITPEAAKLAWQMPFEPQNGIACWMDTEARYRYTMRDGLAYLYTDGSGWEVPGRLLVVRQDTGEIVAKHGNEGEQADKIGGLWYLMGNKVITRWDAAHGPRHGGRHPWRLWEISDGTISRLPGLLDMNEFTNGYEVNMEHPVIAGFLLERNEEGRVVCYDLRADN
jgi:outer membrane protein assembly factor BamB